MVEPFYSREGITLYCGDNREVVPQLDVQVSAVVTDPPYGLNFMGKEWDNPSMLGQVVKHDGRERQSGGLHRGPGTNSRGYADNDPLRFQMWFQEFAEVIRDAMLPGAHLLAFGGTRTWHRLAVAIEDAGLEVRDTLCWLYGSGFPKSLDVSKAIDKRRDDRHDIENVVRFLEASRVRSGVTRQQVEDHFGTVNIGQGFFTITPGSTPRVPTWEQWLDLKALLGFGDDMDAEVWRLNGRKGQPGEAWYDREVISRNRNVRETHQGEDKHVPNVHKSMADPNITAPATPEAEQWAGWGTALKPAFEPVVCARKPLTSTVAAQVLATGTGAINVDGCRIGTTPEDIASRVARNGSTSRGEPGYMRGWSDAETPRAGISAGRWPANVILDEESAALLDAMSGERRTGGVGTLPKTSQANIYGDGWGYTSRDDRFSGDTGGASRFFKTVEADLPIDEPGTMRFMYCPKASRAERNAGLDGMPEVSPFERGGPSANFERMGSKSTARQNHHPTVKPLALMRWLLTLVTPPNGTVLDPFAGSGSTLVAAAQLGISAIGVEMSEEYAEIAARRIDHALDERALGRRWDNGTDASRSGGKVQVAAGRPGFGADRDDGYQQGTGREYATKGRWPANVLMDQAAADVLDAMSEGTRASKPSRTGTRFARSGQGWGTGDHAPLTRDDTGGGASRFMVVIAPEQLSFLDDERAAD